MALPALRPIEAKLAKLGKLGREDLLDSNEALSQVLGTASFLVPLPTKMKVSIGLMTQNRSRCRFFSHLL